MTKVAGMKLPSAPNTGAALMMFSYFHRSHGARSSVPAAPTKRVTGPKPADLLRLSFPARSARKNASQHDSVDSFGIHDTRFLQDAKTRYVSIWPFAQR